MRPRPSKPLPLRTCPTCRCRRDPSFFALGHEDCDSCFKDEMFLRKLNVRRVKLERAKAPVMCAA